MTKWGAYLQKVDKETLHRMYWNDGLSTREISKLIGLGDHMNVLRYMKRFGIKTRLNLVKPKYMMTKINVKHLTSIDLSYLAGIIDGEGCIYIGDNITGARICVLNTNKELIRWVSSIFNSNVKIIESKINDGYSRKTYYQTILTRHSDLIALLKVLIPYLRIKKSKAIESVKILQDRVNLINRDTNS